MWPTFGVGTISRAITSNSPPLRPRLNYYPVGRRAPRMNFSTLKLVGLLALYGIVYLPYKCCRILAGTTISVLSSRYLLIPGFVITLGTLYLIHAVRASARREPPQQPANQNQSWNQDATLEAHSEEFQSAFWASQIFDLPPEELKKMTVTPGLFANPKLLNTAIEQGIQLGSCEKNEANVFHWFARLTVDQWNLESYQVALKTALQRETAIALLNVVDNTNGKSTPMAESLYSPTFLKFPGKAPFDCILRFLETVPGTEQIYLKEDGDSHSIPKMILRRSQEVAAMSNCPVDESMFLNPTLFVLTMERIAEAVGKYADKDEGGENEIVDQVLKTLNQIRIADFTVDYQRRIEQAIIKIAAPYGEIASLKTVVADTEQTRFEAILRDVNANHKWANVLHQNKDGFENLARAAITAFHPIPVTARAMAEKYVADWRSDKEEIPKAEASITNALHNLYEKESHTFMAVYANSAFAEGKYPVVRALYGMSGNLLLQ